MLHLLFTESGLKDDAPMFLILDSIYYMTLILFPWIQKLFFFNGRCCSTEWCDVGNLLGDSTKVAVRMRSESSPHGLDQFLAEVSNFSGPEKTILSI